MAFEILNNSRITPHRLHALLRLIPRLNHPKRDDLQALLMPEALGSDNRLFNEVYRAAVNCSLIRELPDGVVELCTVPERIETVDGYRGWLQENFLSVTDENTPNHLLNLFAAWYFSRDEVALQLEEGEIERQFNDQIYPHQEERAFNTTKFNGWQLWADFLGLGWYLPRGNSRRLVPDPYRRILPILPALLPPLGQPIAFGVFVMELGGRCPELDQGALYEYSLLQSGSQRPAMQASLGLSSALRGLHEAGQVELIRRADASEIWRLFPSDINLWNEVTHIQCGVHNAR